MENNSNNVVNGNLCQECLNNKNCKDNKCPVHKHRRKPPCITRQT